MFHQKLSRDVVYSMLVWLPNWLYFFVTKTMDTSRLTWIRPPTLQWEWPAVLSGDLTLPGRWRPQGWVLVIPVRGTVVNPGSTQETWAPCWGIDLMGVSSGPTQPSRGMQTQGAQKFSVAVLSGVTKCLVRRYCRNLSGSYNSPRSCLWRSQYESMWV